MILFLPLESSFPSDDKRDLSTSADTKIAQGVCENADSWAPPPEILILVAAGPHLEKHHSPQTLSEGPTETEFFMLQHPHQGFEVTNRDSPKEARLFQGRFKLGRRDMGWELEISQRVLCEITMAYFAVEPQQHLIKKRSVGPLESIINYFCQCHTQPCLGKFAGTSANLKGFGV